MRETGSTRKAGGAAKMKAAISATCVILATAHMIWPTVQVDIVTFVLLVVAALPWLAAVIRSVELPGGFKIELQDVKAATEKVTAGGAAKKLSQPVPALREDKLSFLRDVAKEDPNLALVGLRIEIERRLSELVGQVDLPTTRRSAGVLLRELVADKRIDPRTAAGLGELIALGNQAAHGAKVTSSAAVWSLDTGPFILQALDGLVEGRPNGCEPPSAPLVPTGAPA